jgi:hypothetical protein
VPDRASGNPQSGAHATLGLQALCALAHHAIHRHPHEHTTLTIALDQRLP